MKANKVIKSLLLSTLVLTIGGGTSLAATTLNGTGTINFEKDTKPTKPIDPEKPGTEVEPEDKDDIVVDPGPAADLNLDLISNFDFETLSNYKVSTTEQTKSAKPIKLKSGESRGNWAQVTDQRAGTPAGWKLSAKLDADFENATGAKLPGAYITLADQNVMSDFPNTTAPANATTVELKPGIEADVLNVAVGKGNGTTTVEFGTSTTSMAEAVKLHILPGTGVETASAYTANIVWTLAEI